MYSTASQKRNRKIKYDKQLGLRRQKAYLFLVLLNWKCFRRVRAAISFLVYGHNMLKIRRENLYAYNPRDETRECVCVCVVNVM